MTSDSLSHYTINSLVRWVSRNGSCGVGLKDSVTFSLSWNTISIPHFFDFGLQHRYTISIIHSRQNEIESIIAGCHRSFWLLSEATSTSPDIISSSSVNQIQRIPLPQKSWLTMENETVSYLNVVTNPRNAHNPIWTVFYT